MYDTPASGDPGNSSESVPHADTAGSPTSSTAAGGAGSTSDPNHADATSTHDAETSQLLENFPPEIATLLIMAGVAGMLLPGPVGSPLLIAGGVVIWPKTFRPIERWFRRKFPCLHREGVIQLKEFVGDLQKRFPNK